VRVGKRVGPCLTALERCRSAIGTQMRPAHACPAFQHRQ
jgi:hypothetical protein